jgi:hypothetical protein
MKKLIVLLLALLHPVMRGTANVLSVIMIFINKLKYLQKVGFEILTAVVMKTVFFVYRKLGPQAQKREILL